MPTAWTHTHTHIHKVNTLECLITVTVFRFQMLKVTEWKMKVKVVFFKFLLKSKYFHVNSAKESSVKSLFFSVKMCFNIKTFKLKLKTSRWWWFLFYFNRCQRVLDSTCFKLIIYGGLMKVSVAVYRKIHSDLRMYRASHGNLIKLNKN